jgi:hypothetical protein
LERGAASEGRGTTDISGATSLELRGESEEGRETTKEGRGATFEEGGTTAPARALTPLTPLFQRERRERDGYAEGS